jgi:phosphoglucomutase
LSELGFGNVYVVPEQEHPDPDFSTVDYPNPEDEKAFTLAKKLALEVGADLIVGTDPDADRVGVLVKNKSGEYNVLTGNMTGVLLCEYILSQKKANGTLPENGAVISTIVSTDMTKKITAAYGVEYIEVLTGFKYIGEKIKEFEANGSTPKYLFGFEESYGCSAGTYCRDKDAVVAVTLVCEMAAYYKTRSMTLYDGLTELYAKYGYYKESVKSITLKGIDGIEQMKKMMEALRENAPVEIAGKTVVEARDYKSGLINGTDPTNLPVSDVLYYTLEDGSWFCVRPSGTEPKIKIYIGVAGGSAEEADEKIKLLDGEVGKLF